jgi:hypothetical protein
MNGVFLVYIMIGVNHLAPIPGHMISSMQIISFQRFRKGENNYFIPTLITSKLFIMVLLMLIWWSRRCNLASLVAEVEGKLIVRDTVEVINELESMVKSMQWEVRMTYSKDKEGLLCVQKSTWRPKETETLKYAIV